MCLDPPCHNDATCTAIGPDLFGCKCNGIVVGDGITSCEMPGTVKNLSDSQELELERTFKKKAKKTRFPTTPPVICFPGHALVRVHHKNNNNEHELGHSQLEMRHVQVGDRVLGMNGKYTPVYAFAHQAPHLTERYVRIFTNATGSSSGATTPLELSDRHYLYLHKHQEFPVLPADLKKGDVLLGAAGEPHEVVKIEFNVMSHGVFAPLTADGTIVVNGVVTFNHAYVLLTHPDEPSDYIYWNNRLWRGASDENRKFKFMTQHGFMHMTCSPLRIMALGISPWFGTLSNHEGMNYLSCAYVQAYTWWKQSASSGTTKTSSSLVKCRIVWNCLDLVRCRVFGIIIS